MRGHRRLLVDMLVVTTTAEELDELALELIRAAERKRIEAEELAKPADPEVPSWVNQGEEGSCER